MNRLVFFIILLLIIPTFSQATSIAEMVQSRDKGPTTFTKNYLSKLQSENKPLFYSDCHLKDGGKAIVVMPLNSPTGLYIETTTYKTVVNAGHITWKGINWEANDIGGGVYTLNRITALIAELWKQPFYFLLPNKLDIILTSKSKNTCIESPK